MSSTTSVTVLGLGAMGQAIAQAFLDAGHPTTVWNRSPAKAEGPAAQGAVAAPTAAEAVAASELTFVCLLDYDSVHDVLDPVASRLAGRTLVNLTNSTPEQARAFAIWAQELGVTYLDGGMMATPPMIAKPGALFFYSGERSAFEAHRPVLERLSDAHFVGTDPGLAALWDLSLLSGMYGLISGILHSYALIGSEKIPAGDFAPFLKAWLTAMAEATDSYAHQLDTGDHTAGVVSNLAMQTVGFDNILQVAEDQGVSTELLAPLKPLMQRRVADGFGDGDLSSLVGLLRKGR